MGRLGVVSLTKHYSNWGQLATSLEWVPWETPVESAVSQESRPAGAVSRHVVSPRTEIRAKRNHGPALLFVQHLGNGFRDDRRLAFSGGQDAVGWQRQQRAAGRSPYRRPLGRFPIGTRYEIATFCATLSEFPRQVPEIGPPSSGCGRLNCRRYDVSWPASQIDDLHFLFFC